VSLYGPAVGSWSSDLAHGVLVRGRMSRALPDAGSD
jgi:hypothetical protein